jgi:AraC-like DNA-binding protein
LSLTEFVTVSGVLRCVADAIDGAVGASFLTGLAESLKVKDTQSTNQLLDVFLGLLDRDLSACCLPIDELARKLGSQPLHLERACVPLNMTPAMCRTAYQMRRIVRALIEGPDEHVKQIAYQVGYRHPPNLTRAFRVYFGLPPQDFRSLWRGQACR